MDLSVCPWSGFRPGELQFCEAPLCGWVVHPAETWTNVSYLIAAAILYARSRSRLDREFAFAALVVGIFSSLYHASHVWWLETLDLGSMLFLVTLMIRENFRRWGIHDPGKLRAIYGTLLTLAWAAQFLLSEGWMRLSVFSSLVVFSVAMEVPLAFRRPAAESPRKKLGEKTDYRWFWGSLVIFLVAWGFWLLDARKIWCEPDNHFISGHGAWHLINAACFLGLARYYRQFRNELVATEPLPPSA